MKNSKLGAFTFTLLMVSFKLPYIKKRATLLRDIGFLQSITVTQHLSTVITDFITEEEVKS